MQKEIIELTQWRELYEAAAEFNKLKCWEWMTDTSVLIDYLKNRKNSQTEKFAEIMRRGIPFGINEWIYLELLQGCKSEKDFRLLKKYLASQSFYSLKRGHDSYADAAWLFFRLKKKGINLRSSIECLIAQTAIENDLLLLHNDSDFKEIAKVSKLKEY